MMLGTAQLGKIMVERRENRIEPIPRENQDRRKEETRDYAGSEKLAPLFTERVRQMLRLYNSATGKCDLTEEEATKREAREQAVSEELERRRQERLAAWEAGIGLDKKAKQSLGKLNAPAAWFLLTDKVAQALEEQPDHSQQLAVEMYLFDQPDDPLQLHDFEDLLEVIVGMNPVRGINHFHYINPDFDPHDIQKANSFQTLRAMIRIFTVSGRWLERF